MRSPREIQNHFDQAFIQRGDEMTKPSNTLFITQSLCDSHAESDPDVLVGVVIIDPVIAICADVEVEKTVRGELMKHVIEEGDASLNVTLARAVEINRD